MDEEPLRAWVIYHEYSQEGNTKIVRVYMDEQRAKDDFALLADDRNASGGWHLAEAPMYGDAPI